MPLDEEAMRQVFRKILEEAKRNKTGKRTMESRIFWKNSLHIQHKYPVTIEKVSSLLDEEDLNVLSKSGDAFGVEKDQDKLVFTPAMMVPDPDPEFFQKMIEMGDMKYESENEVDTFFVRDLLEQLGYDFKDIAMQHPIKIKAGRGYSTIKPDFGIFDGSARDRKHALLVVESKLKKMTQNDVNQAKSYTELLKTPYCMMTNGKTIYIYKNNYPKFDKYMKFNVSELKNNWKKLYRSISKEAIKALK